MVKLYVHGMHIESIPVTDQLNRSAPFSLVVLCTLYSLKVLGPVVQSIVSLTISLVVKMLTVLV